MKRQSRRYQPLSISFLQHRTDPLVNELGKQVQFRQLSPLFHSPRRPDHRAGTFLALFETLGSICPDLVPIDDAARSIRFDSKQAMNVHQTYGLTYRLDTNRLLRRWTWLSQTARFGTVLFADVAVILAMAWLTGVGYHFVVYHAAGDILSFVEVGAVSAVIFVTLGLLRSEYALSRFFSLKPQLRRVAQLWNTTLICLLAAGFLTQMSAVFSRGWMMLYYATTICVLIGVRSFFVRATVVASRNGLISARRIFLFGTGRHIEDFVTRYQPRNVGVTVVGCHFLTPVSPDATKEGKRRSLVADLEAAVASARILEPDAVFLVMPWSDADTIDRCVETLLNVPAEIHLGAEHVLDRFEHVKISKLGALASLQLTRPPLSGIELLLKRMCDLLLASIALLLLTPVLVATGILIKLDDPGPVFFVQRRFGFNQKAFRIVKFRSMRTLDDGPTIEQAKKDDPRVTRIGSWLRRWNIDELPQLFNVIKGDMSLVGPRPHALSHDREFERLISLYARRHRVKPGITGWAQIHGFRGETDTEDKIRNRVAHDLYYIENWSLLLDFQILVRTVISPASYRNAY
jgi:Undecaprenyl-phosphate glucose phosphotransferase